MSEYIIALDQGTTSSRAIVFNNKAEIVSKAQFPFRQIYPQPSWVEHDPMEILDTQLRALRDAMSAGNIAQGSVAGIGITNQRETTVVWDRHTGQPVYNAIVWQCRRTAAVCDRLHEEGAEDYIRSVTGLRLDAYFSGTKIQWILDNVPGARDKAEAGDLLFGTVDTWLIWNLTGGKVHVTDYSNASRTMLFDIHKLCWDKKICELLSIPESMLPEPVPNSKIYGYLDGKSCRIQELDGVPVCGAAGDQQAALFGQGCFETGQVKNTYGTGCFTLMNTGNTPVASNNGLVTTIAWSLGENPVYALEGSVFNGGSTIQWLRDELGIISSAHECDLLAAEVPDANGVIVVPAFTGLGAPYWDMYARGTITGLTRGSNKCHIARAVLECIAYQVADLVTAMSADLQSTQNVNSTSITAGTPADNITSEIPVSSGCLHKTTLPHLLELRVDGGASVSDILLQFQADLLNIPVNRPSQVETTAMGAAFLAGLAVGVWKSTDEIASLRKVDRVFTSKETEENRQHLLHQWHRAIDRASNWIEP